MIKLVKWLIFSNFNGIPTHIKAMRKTPLDRYEEIVIDALKGCSAKLRKNFKSAFISAMILYMVLPRKINFTRMGRNSDSCEQRFRQLYDRGFDWMEFNIELMKMQFTENSRKAIAIDASYISKGGKHDSLYRKLHHTSLQMLGFQRRTLSTRSVRLDFM